MKKLLYIPIILLLFCGQAWGATYYMSPSGSDANDGSEGSPWKTMEYVCESIIDQGDTVRMTAGTYDQLYAGGDDYVEPSFGAGSGTTTFKAYPADASVTISIASGTTQWFYNQTTAISNPLKFSGITFDIGDIVAGSFFRVNRQVNLLFYNCVFDFTSTASWPFRFDYIGTGTILDFERCKFYAPSATATIFELRDAVRAMAISFKSCEINGIGKRFIDALYGRLSLTAYNNTIGGMENYWLDLYGSENVLDIKNNIYYTLGDRYLDGESFVFMLIREAAIIDFLANPGNFDFTNNIVYNFESGQFGLDSIISTKDLKQFDGTSATDDASQELGNGTVTRAGVSFTSATFAGGGTIPPTSVGIHLSKKGNGFTGTDDQDILMVVRNAADEVLASAVAIAAPINTNLSASATLYTARFDYDEVTTGMASATAYKLSIEYSNGDADHCAKVHYDNVASGGTLVTYDGSWAAADTTKLPLAYLAPRLPDEELPIDITNKFVNPHFTDYAGGDFTIDPTIANYTLNRGSAGDLPDTDINGDAWTGSDVGCYKAPAVGTVANPTGNALFPTASYDVAFVGDSIMNASNAPNGSECWALFGTMTGLNVVQNDEYSSRLEIRLGHAPNEDEQLLYSIAAASGGLRSRGSLWIIDRVATEYTPTYAFYAIGVNDLNLTTSNSPRPVATIISQIKKGFARLAYWGITPIWLGVIADSDDPGTTPPGLDTGYTDQVNAEIEAYCETNGYRYGSMTDRMKFLSTWETDYYTDGIHPDNGAGGNLVIASLAENLYYSRHDYWLANTNTDSLQAGTYQHPLTVAQFNALSALKTGESGRIVSATEALTSTPNTTTAGTSGKVLTFKNIEFQKGIVIDQQYWGIDYSLISGDDDTDSNGLLVSATNFQGAYNLTIDSCVDAIEHSENITAKNIIFEGCTNDINTTAGAATTSNNYASADGDPLFVSATDFNLKNNSPCKNTGTPNGSTPYSSAVTDLNGNTITDASGDCLNKYGTVLDIGAYEYRVGAAIMLGL